MTESVEVLLHGADAPHYQHAGDAGADLCSVDEVTIAPGERVTVGTGVAIALPDGYVGLVVPRSGLAAKHGITLVNTPGTIDAGYRGEIRVVMINTDRSESYQVQAGDRIAQLLVLPVARARFIQVDRLPGSERGEGGFGSTGSSTSAFAARTPTSDTETPLGASA